VRGLGTLGQGIYSQPCEIRVFVDVFGKHKRRVVSLRLPSNEVVRLLQAEELDLVCVGDLEHG
jgi:hypothetical protein